jgi:hypothetical protein
MRGAAQKHITPGKLERDAKRLKGKSISNYEKGQCLQHANISDVAKASSDSGTMESNYRLDISKWIPSQECMVIVTLGVGTGSSPPTLSLKFFTRKASK